MPKWSTLEAQKKAKPQFNQYYVTAANVGKELGGVKIVERGRQRVVTMTATQARWWLDHGVLSEHSQDQ